MVVALKKCEDCRATTAIHQAKAAARKAAEREATWVEKEATKLQHHWVQAVASYSGAMGPSAALNTPATLTRPTGSSQYSLPAFLPYSFMPYTGYVFSPYTYSTPHGYATPSPHSSEPAITPAPSVSSSASHIPKTPPSASSWPSAGHPYPHLHPTPPPTHSSRTSSQT